MLNDMEIIREQPIYQFTGYNEEERIELYSDDLRAAEVGNRWYCDDQDDNGSWTWVVILTYKDNDGCMLVRSTMEESDGVKGVTIGTWIELHK